MVTDFHEAHLMKRLVECIEEAPYTLHRGVRIGGFYECGRLKKGLAFSRPEDCDCGLDALLAEAREFIGDPSGDKPPPNYQPPVPVKRRPR